MPDKPNSDQAIFETARQLPSADEQDAYLRQTCGHDPSQMHRVQALLRAYNESQSFLEAPAIDSGSTISLGMIQAPGTRIGPYTLEQQIGEGGMGVVYQAEQHQPVRRRVALKVIKPGMDSARVIARFEAERTALSLMDHPNIARVLDAGTSDAGYPYFVMELVKGQPITEYCDQNRLTTRQRLELFVPVCLAIQHAHQKGIIHRDIKPTNVLVAEYDHRPVPKVIDFGVAKALSQPLTAESVFTEHGQVLGTLEYMSPEQARVNQLDIDTRSDVYSLGVLLYELLTGNTPFDRRRLRSGTLEEVLRIIQEEEPRRPSARLSDSDNLPSLAACRNSEPRKLPAMLHDELDWIVLKCLEKDRKRRYDTASGLALDIQRYLADETVLACPPSAVYRMGKFARKHKTGVAISLATLLLLLTGFAALAVSNSLIRAEQAKTAARADELKKRSDELDLVTNFQAGIFDQLDLTEVGRLLTANVIARFDAALAREDISEADRADQVQAFASQLNKVNTTDAARDLIDRSILSPAVWEIDKQFADQPLIDAQLRQQLAYIYHILGLYETALPLKERALAIHRRLLGDDHIETIKSLKDMGRFLLDSGNPAEAEPYIREALMKFSLLMGRDHLSVASSMNDLASVLSAQGKIDEAEPYAREVLEMYRRQLGDEDCWTLAAISNLGTLVRMQGKLSEAESLTREALDKQRRVLVELDPDTLISISQLGRLLEAQGKFGEAEAYFRDALEKHRRTLGEAHPRTFFCLFDLGGILHAQGKEVEAEGYDREAITVARRVFGGESRFTLNAMHALGVVLVDEGKFGEAEPLMREVVEKRRRVLGEDHRDTLVSTTILGVLLKAQNRAGDAEPFLREAEQKSRRNLGEEDADTLVIVNHLGLLLEDQGKLGEAESCFREVLDKRCRVVGEENPDTLTSMNNLGTLLMYQGKLGEAEPYLGKVLDKRRRLLGETNPETLISINNWGILLKDQGKLDEAEPFLREALEKRRTVLGEDHPGTLESIGNLAMLLQDQGKLGEAEQLSREVLEKHRNLLGDEHPATLRSFNNLGFRLLNQGKLSEAEPYLREARETCCRVLGENHMLTLALTNNLGKLLAKQGKNAESIDLLAPIETSARKAYVGKNASGLGVLLKNLGRARTGLGQFADAEANLLEAHAVFVQTRGESHKDTVDCTRAIVELYDAWHAAEPGQGYDARGMEWKAKLWALCLGSGLLIHRH